MVSPRNYTPRVWLTVSLVLSLIVLSFAGWDVSARRKAINLAGSDGYDYRLEYKSGGKPHLVRMANSAAPAAQVDLPGPAGSSQFGATVTVLPNGNFVVTDPGFDAPGPIADVGAVYLYDKATLTVISTLTGGKAGDQIGNSGIAVLSNGNFVVLSPNWDNPVPTVADVGAVTWCSAATGCNGLVTAGNSLIGGKASDKVGGGGFSGGVTVLTNGNYVVRSPDWDNPTGPVSNVGAVTWGNGTGGTVGMVTESNSLIGGRTDDAVGSSGASKGGVTALTNGNYAVASPGWDNPVGPVVDVGAVTWCNGMTGGTVGLVTAGNSLIGGRANDNVGSFSSNGGVTAFPNGNYAVNLLRDKA